jgi:hypothetical protein
MISTLDISSVTDRLIAHLDNSVNVWPGWIDNGGTISRFGINVSGQMPETVRNEDQCRLTVYLFHLTADPGTRNSPLTGPRAQPNVTQAFGLTLFYLISSFARDSAIKEQQSMSIALKALHERGTFVDPIDGFTFTITFESEKDDVANRRWQSFSTPFRLSAVFRVGVTFLTPVGQPPAPAPAPSRIGLSTGPTALPFATAGALTATASEIDFTPLNPQPTDTIVHHYTPAVVSPNGQFSVFGTGLDQPTAARLFLLDSNQVETEVTAWKTAAPQQTASRFVAKLPNNVGALPGGSPTPGVYQIRVGSSVALGDARNYRSNAVPLLIAAQAGPVPAPWNPVAGEFSFNGLGFVDGATEIYLSTVELTPRPLGSAPGAGEFSIAVALNSIGFKPPAGIAPGTYFVRLRVRGVEGMAVGRVVIP